MCIRDRCTNAPRSINGGSSIRGNTTYADRPLTMIKLIVRYSNRGLEWKIFIQSVFNFVPQRQLASVISQRTQRTLKGRGEDYSLFGVKELAVLR